MTQAKPFFYCDNRELICQDRMQLYLYLKTLKMPTSSLTRNGYYAQTVPEDFKITMRRRFRKNKYFHRTVFLNHEDMETIKAMLRTGQSIDFKYFPLGARTAPFSTNEDDYGIRMRRTPEYSWEEVRKELIFIDPDEAQLPFYYA